MKHIKIKDRLQTRYEDQGHNGEKQLVVPIVYDPKTGFEFDVAEIHEMEVGNVYDIRRTAIQDK